MFWFGGGSNNQVLMRITAVIDAVAQCKGAVDRNAQAIAELHDRTNLIVYKLDQLSAQIAEFSAIPESDLQALQELARLKSPNQP